MELEAIFEWLTVYYWIKLEFEPMGKTKKDFGFWGFYRLKSKRKVNFNILIKYYRVKIFSHNWEEG